MNRKLYSNIFLYIIFFIFLLSLNTFAGQWEYSNSDWYYKIDDGSYAKNAYLWLDEDHDGIAYLYNFDNNGKMSKSTTVEYVYPLYPYDKTIYDVNSDGIITGFHFEDGFYEPINPEGMPPYAIYKNNSGYYYVLNNGKDHYDFKEAKTAKINTYYIQGDNYYDRTQYFIDCGNYYSIDVDILVYDAGTDGTMDYIGCAIPTTAYFSKDCIVNVHKPTGDEVTTISRVIAENNNSSVLYNFFDVLTVNSYGYITSCNMRFAA